MLIYFLSTENWTHKGERKDAGVCLVVVCAAGAEEMQLVGDETCGGQRVQAGFGQEP